MMTDDELDAWEAYFDARFPLVQDGAVIALADIAARLSDITARFAAGDFDDS
jgi:hypothetical protein